MIGNCADHFMLVVNASRNERDAALLRADLSGICTIEMLSDRALLSLQGSRAEDILTALSPAVASMRFMDVRLLAIGRTDCASRSPATPVRMDLRLVSRRAGRSASLERCCRIRR